MEPSEVNKGPRTRRVREALRRGALVLLSAGAVGVGTVSVGPPNAQGDLPEARAVMPAIGVVTFQPVDADGLARVLATAWEGAGALQIPGLAPASLPGDLGELRSSERKELFVRSVLPHVLQANDRVRREREALLAARGRWELGSPLSELETTWVLGVARRYREGKGAADRLRADTGAFLENLLERVDVVPPSLALAQAAIESAWGVSRFSREGNALFGQWVFSRDGGMAPRDRPVGAAYGIARFETIGQAVEAYLRNLNTLWAYQDFRAMRAGMRARGAALDSLELAQGLLWYSERREAYVDELRRIIQGNRMTRFDRSRLAGLERERASGLVGDLGTVTRREGGGGEITPDA